jgi:uncharacterized phage-associated protein
MPAAVTSTFEVAFWFSDMALNCNEYLQPQKLQRLLFLSQAYYAVAFKGKKLMPAVFVADELGPIEPTVYHAFTKGRPDIDVNAFLPSDVEEFLKAIWRRFGNMQADRLARLATETLAYKRALRRGAKAEITIEEMCLAFAKTKDVPNLDQVMKPRVLRMQSGETVAVKSWKPKAAK